MKTHKATVAALLIAFTVVSFPGRSSAIDFTHKELERLQAGKTVNKPLAKSGKGGFFGGTGWAIVDAPVDVVWAAIQDWGAYPDVFPRTMAVKELRKRGKQSLVHMELGYKILRVKYDVNIVRDADKKMLSFNLVHDRPHDLEETRGYWRLFPQKDGRTLVAYAVAVQVPAGIVAFLGSKLEKKLTRYLIQLPKFVKRWVESPSGNRYRTMTAKN